MSSVLTNQAIRIASLIVTFASVVLSCTKPTSTNNTINCIISNYIISKKYLKNNFSGVPTVS